MMEDGGETDLPAEDFKDPMTPMFIKNMMKDFADSLEASGADGEKLVEEYGAASPMDLFDKMILDEESVMKKVMDGDRATFSFGPSDMASKALNLVPYVIVAVVSALLTFAAITMSKKRSSVGTYDEISPLAV